jgi:hypothetical protein
MLIYFTLTSSPTSPNPHACNLDLAMVASAQGGAVPSFRNVVAGSSRPSPQPTSTHVTPNSLNPMETEMPKEASNSLEALNSSEAPSTKNQSLPNEGKNQSLTCIPQSKEIPHYEILFLVLGQNI